MSCVLRTCLKSNHPVVKNRRGKLAIMAEILIATKCGAPKTRIKSKVNLNHEQLGIYIEILLEKKLLTKEINREQRDIFSPTIKGKRFVKTFQEFQILQLNSN